MPTILIIEDRPADRNLLTTILRSAGYEVLSATDGGDALHVLADAHPDLVISDIMMPTIDGYEFVRRMREQPALAATPVIFYTATYHEHEARALALQCGVVEILTKPSPVEQILSTVAAALAAPASAPPAPPRRESFDRERLELVSATLADRIERFSAAADRMSAVMEAAQQLAGEDDPRALLDRVCTEARRVTLAQQAVVGLIPRRDAEQPRLITSGFADDTGNHLRVPSLTESFLATVVNESRAYRVRNPGGRPEALGLPSDGPRVASLLSVPIRSAACVYGWLNLRNKLGADEFTAADEDAAMTLSAHAGIAYERATRLQELHRRIALLETDHRRLSERTQRVREEERSRLSRTLHDRLGQTLAGLKTDLYGLRADVATWSDDRRTAVEQRIESMLGIVGDTLDSVRRIASDLRPAVLDQLGLAAAIDWQAAEFERHFGIQCRVERDAAEIDLERGRATWIFRVVQEALSNVQRHAQATLVIVSVHRSGKALVVSVADNGRGISEERITSRDALGLVGMRERAALLGGTLDITPGKSGGTVVTLTVPLTTRRTTSRSGRRR